MQPRDRFFAVMRGETPDIIPFFTEVPMDVSCLRDVLPPPTDDDIGDQIKIARFFDNTGITIRRGPKQTTLERDDDHYIYQYDTGAVWEEYYRPVFYREMTKFPLQEAEYIYDFAFPDPEIDIEMLKQQVTRIKDAGYIAQGLCLGIWGGIYYFLTSFENILMWMAVEPEAAQVIFDKMGAYVKKVTMAFIEAGVDAMLVESDFGSGNSLLFSREMFRQYCFPWLREMSDLCHAHGVIMHLHSHGHIQDIMDDIVEAGVDLINPIGPSDKNDLAMFKRNWGDKIVIQGGISTTIAQMSAAEMDEHIAQVMETGVKGGRFFPRTESGIPFMPKEQVLLYLDTVKRYRVKYGNKGWSPDK